MSATVLHIVEKLKPNAFAPALMEHFVRQGETLPPQIAIDNPNVSLYFLDDDSQQVIFVETPPDVDLVQAPFYYATQYEHAQRLIAISYDTFHQLAAAIPENNLIFVHSIGRCGSTLISHALNTVDRVQSLSEPDIYTQIHMMRYLDRNRDEEFMQLLKSSTRILGRNTPTLALKFRGMCIHIADLLWRAFPQAKNLFLYRHAESWARSMGIESVPVDLRKQPSTEVPFHRRTIAPLSVAFAERHGRESTPVEMSALMWLSMIDKYLMLHQMGVPFLALRYEDLQAQPTQALAAIFRYCGLSEAAVDAAHAVFSKDSQEGTFLSRANRQKQTTVPLNEEDYAQFRNVLR